MNFHRDVLAAHAQFGGDLESMQKCYDWYGLRDRVQSLEAELQKAREAALEEAAKVAECHFDDRGNGRSGHHSEMDWTDGYREATRGVATAIRALSQDKEAREAAPVDNVNSGDGG